MGQNNLSRYVLEHMEELVITFDKRGLIRYGNKSADRKLEYVNQLSGTHISEIFPNEFTVFQNHISSLRAALGNGDRSWI